MGAPDGGRIMNGFEVIKGGSKSSPPRYGHKKQKKPGPNAVSYIKQNSYQFQYTNLIFFNKVAPWTLQLMRFSLMVLSEKFIRSAVAPTVESM